MTDVKFTPGPWRQDKSDSLEIRAPNGWLVCRVMTDAHDKSCFDGVTANARLIAAAPELYDALEHASRYIAYLLDHLPEDKRENDVWLLARAALKLAGTPQSAPTPSNAEPKDTGDMSRP